MPASPQSKPLRGDVCTTTTGSLLGGWSGGGNFAEVAAGVVAQSARATTPVAFARRLLGVMMNLLACRSPTAIGSAERSRRAVEVRLEIGGRRVAHHDWRAT